MMKRKLFGVFNSVDDAKNVLGLIKKESWNQAELMVIMGERAGADHNGAKKSNPNFEAAAENFLTNNSPASARQINHIWPGLKDVEIAGIGIVKIGYSAPAEANNESIINQKLGELNEIDIKAVEREIAAKKIVAYLEIEEQFLPKLRLIMASNGAELKEANDFHLL